MLNSNLSTIIGKLALTSGTLALFLAYSATATHAQTGFLQ